VFAEDASVADVAADSGHAAVAGLVHKGAFGFAGGGGGCGEARAKAVSGEGGRIEAELLDVTLHDQRDTFTGEPLRQNLAVAVHDAEDRSGLDPGGFTPPLERPNGTGRTPSARRNADRSSLPFLIGFAAADRDDESAGPRSAVFNIERH